jgi:uncharacterized membrane protein YidH (DUF202 family)
MAGRPGGDWFDGLTQSIHPSTPYTERTFLAWLNMSVTLASISVAILAFADHNEFSQLYGFILLPVAIAFVVYALRTYVRR